MTAVLPTDRAAPPILGAVVVALGLVFAGEARSQTSPAQAAHRTPEVRLQAAMQAESYWTREWRRRRAYPVIDLADRAAVRGDFDTAVVEIKRYLAADPNHLALRWRLLDLLRQQGRDAEAVEQADRLMASLPRFSPALMEKGEALHALGLSSTAMDTFVEALEQGDPPPADRRRVLAGLVEAALASGRGAEARVRLAAEPPEESDTPASLALLSARAVLAERERQPEEAVDLWRRVARRTASTAQRRGALLAETQLLAQAGRPDEALALLRDPAHRALFTGPESGAAETERLRYARLVSVLAEGLGEADLAGSAAATAVSLRSMPTTTAELTDRVRAARLRPRSPAGRAAPDALGCLLGTNGQPFERPQDADDDTWIDYALLLGATAAAAEDAALATAALRHVPLSRLSGDWRTGAQVAETALRIGQPRLALDALEPWDARRLAAAGAPREAALHVLVLRANAAAAAYNLALEGESAAEAEGIDSRIASPVHRAQRLLDERPRAAAALLEAARGVTTARIASAGSGEERAAATRQHARLLFALGDAHRRGGALPQAIEALREGLAAEDSPTAHWILAEILRQTGQRDAAAAELRRLGESGASPADRRLAWLALGDVLWAGSAPGPALEAFRTAVAAGAGRDARLFAAEAAYRLKRPADLVWALAPLAAPGAEGTLPTAWRDRLCRALAVAGRQDEAVRCVDQMAATAGRDPRSILQAAELAGAIGEPDERLRLLDAAWRQGRWPEAGLAIGDALMRQGKPDEAADVFGEVWAGSAEPRAGLARGEALLAARQPAEAAAALEAVLERSGGVLPTGLAARTFAALGHARDADGDPDGAAAAWRQAQVPEPDPDLQLAMADSLVRAGRPEEADEALAAFDDRMGQAAPAEARLRRRELGIRADLAQGRTEAARAEAEELARRAPTPDRLGMLADARAAAGDRAGAAEAAATAADAAPHDPQRQAQSGYTLLRLGEPAAAAERFESALSEAPDRLGVRQDLPRALVLAGEWPAARRAYAEAIDRTAAHANGVGGSRADLEALHDLRRENLAATRAFTFELLESLCTPGGAAGCRLSRPTVERLGSAGIGAATVAWTPHLPGDPDPYRIAVYGRLLWANDPGTVSLRDRSVQGGFGIRVRPVAGLPVFLWAERMVAIGEQAQDNWMLRVTAGWETGAVWRAFGTDDWRRGWRPYTFIYGDLAKLLARDRDWLGVLEARVGGSLQPHEQAMLVPYAFLRGELDNARSGEANSVQVGLGLSARLRTTHHDLYGYLAEPELFARVVQDVTRSGGKVGTRFLLGLAVRF